MKINPKAIMMREVITKVVQILASKKIKVTQRGTKAYVQYDEKTLEPILVNVPYIPDDADDLLLDAIQGFVDHELGHIFFTDPKSIVEANKKGVGNLHNALEDTFIERKQRDHYKGSGLNLENVGKFFLKNYTDKKLKSDPANRIGYLMIPAIRAWAGQLLFKEYMDEHGYWKDMEDITKRLGKLVDEIPKINSSWESLDLAERMSAKLGSKEKPKMGKAEPTKKKRDDKFEEATETDDKFEEKATAPKSDDAFEEGSSSSTGEDDDKFEEKKASEKSDEKFTKEMSEEDEGAESGETIVSGEADEEAGESSYEDDADPGSAKVETESSEEGEEGAGGSTEGEGEEGAGSGYRTEEDDGDDGSSMLGKLKGMGDYDDALSDSISEVSRIAAGKSEYFIYTKDLDVIEPFKITTPLATLDKRVERMQAESDAMVGVMQKDLERAIAARSLAVWRPGLRRGRLNSSSLMRLATGDDRVFRRREVSVSKDVAISLLVDNSGSMSGKRIETASAAAFAMSSVLDRMNISNEVLGFTARYDHLGGARGMKDESEAGVRYSRVLPLYIPIYKSFDDRLTPESKRKIAAMACSERLLQENVDGESVQIAAQRLAARKEKRHILMVFSDGNPACPGDSAAQEVHLKNTVKMVEKSGIDVIGIGIQSRAVEKFYSKHVVLNDVNQLAGEVMVQLRKFLLVD